MQAAIAQQQQVPPSTQLIAPYSGPTGTPYGAFSFQAPLARLALPGPTLALPATPFIDYAAWPYRESPEKLGFVDEKDVTGSIQNHMYFKRIECEALGVGYGSGALKLKVRNLTDGDLSVCVARGSFFCNKTPQYQPLIVVKSCSGILSPREQCEVTLHAFCGAKQLLCPQSSVLLPGPFRFALTRHLSSQRAVWAYFRSLVKADLCSQARHESTLGWGMVAEEAEFDYINTSFVELAEEAALDEINTSFVELCNFTQVEENPPSPRLYSPPRSCSPSHSVSSSRSCSPPRSVWSARSSPPHSCSPSYASHSAPHTPEPVVHTGERGGKFTLTSSGRRNYSSAAARRARGSRS